MPVSHQLSSKITTNEREKTVLDEPNESDGIWELPETHALAFSYQEWLIFVRDRTAWSYSSNHLDSMVFIIDDLSFESIWESFIKYGAGWDRSIIAVQSTWFRNQRFSFTSSPPVRVAEQPKRLFTSGCSSIVHVYRAKLLICEGNFVRWLQRTLRWVWSIDRAKNGEEDVSISNMATPNCHQSTEKEYGRLSSISGGMVSGTPTMEYV